MIEKMFWDATLILKASLTARFSCWAEIGYKSGHPAPEGDGKFPTKNAFVGNFH